MNILVLHAPDITPAGTLQPGGHSIKSLPQIEEELAQIGTNAGTLLRELQGKHKSALIGLSHATTSDRTASNTT